MGWAKRLVRQSAFTKISPRHCEEPLRRSNPDCLCGKILDCFAPLAMTEQKVIGNRVAVGARDLRRWWP
uniref:Uncharacterized protein n=1 Tax=Bradyrhizobium amphicarpaeae TaxID=1404768 RepID=A0A2U8PRU5_9BRAD|nr:hypothetical protein CIT40_09285 [Bradyrhizobium amphicarpaeae]